MLAALDTFNRAAPFVLAFLAALLSRARPPWRPVAAQLAGLATIVAAGPWTRAHPRADVFTLALWPGVALAGAVAALAGSRRARLTLAAYALLSALAALCYSPGLWWLGERLLVLARVAVGPALVVAWLGRKDERPQVSNPRPSTSSRWERTTSLPGTGRVRDDTSFEGSAPRQIQRRRADGTPRIAPTQVAALAPAVEAALSPLGPWARLALGGIVAVREDWDLGLVGSAVAYAVVALAMVVEVRHGSRARCAPGGG